MRRDLPQSADARVCCHCQSRPISGRKRKYCDVCSSEASAIWKRAQRARWSRSGEKYWRADWHSDEQRRVYFREYMRRYRQRRRVA